MAILTIARLTLREAARRRLLIAVAVLTAVLIGATGWGFQRLLAFPCNGPCEPGLKTGIAATLLILVLFMFSFVFSLCAVFVAAPSISTDIETGLLLALLPRPIRRSDVVLGKWLGLALLVGGYTVATAGLEFLAVKLTIGYLPPNPTLAMVYLVAEALALLLLALLLSTRLAPMTGGIIALVLFGVAWIGGIAEAIGVAFGNSTITHVGAVSSLMLPTDGLWRGALYHLEPAIFQAATRATSANPFLVSGPPSAAFTLWTVFWAAGMLGLTIWSFGRREL